MPSPFPGMNPYLEQPDFWPEVHHLLISIMMEALVPQVRPKYRVAIEKRIYEVNEGNGVLVGIPDVTVYRQKTTPKSSESATAVAVATPPKRVKLPVTEEVRESYLEVRDMATGEVVTAIELLSPANKRPGKGREVYQEKRQAILGSRTNLVEIDLLRAGEPMPMFGEDIEGDYRILISRGYQRPLGDLYLFNLRDSLPTVPIPLRSEDAEAVLNFQELLNLVYERAGYDDIIDYTKEPVPPLSESDTIWMREMLSL
ncbi:MAG TPA: DUF4058 family protein [Oscillatoriaceae cyanobacterium M33_DOE_052]|uniref:DUF4058 family protein n=1 Tax=Planktothricoides sp. SpSt-374 TaxID=2282167 RepID=A0A7C3ZGS2_9CYAN|nr:DUF4058 family protein [Oscillatoriaceae cyanobacterium M33_DOE_052]